MSVCSTRNATSTSVLFTKAIWTWTSKISAVNILYLSIYLSLLNLTFRIYAAGPGRNMYIYVSGNNPPSCADIHVHTNEAQLLTIHLLRLIPLMLYHHCQQPTSWVFLPQPNARRMPIGKSRTQTFNTLKLEWLFWSGLPPPPFPNVLFFSIWLAYEFLFLPHPTPRNKPEVRNKDNPPPPKRKQKKRWATDTQTSKQTQN